MDKSDTELHNRFKEESEQANLQLEREAKDPEATVASVLLALRQQRDASQRLQDFNTAIALRRDALQKLASALDAKHVDDDPPLLELSEHTKRNIRVLKSAYSAFIAHYENATPSGTPKEIDELHHSLKRLAMEARSAANWIEDA